MSGAKFIRKEGDLINFINVIIFVLIIIYFIDFIITKKSEFFHKRFIFIRFNMLFILFIIFISKARELVFHLSNLFYLNVSIVISSGIYIILFIITYIMRKFQHNLNS
jgi:hypothetical protein